MQFTSKDKRRVQALAKRSTATARRAVGRTTRGVVGAAAVKATSASRASEGSMPGPSGRVGRGGEHIVLSTTEGGGGASSLDAPSSDGGSKTGGAMGASTGRGRVGGVR